MEYSYKRFKWYNVFAVIVSVYLGIFAVICALLHITVSYIFSGYAFIITAVMTGVLALMIKKAKNSIPKAVIQTLLCLGFGLVSLIVLFFMAFEPSATSHLKWQYGLMNDFYFEHNGAPDFFPDEIPSSASGYEYDYRASVMQAQGHISVGFNADDDYVRTLTEELEASAVRTFKVSEYQTVIQQVIAEDPDDDMRGFGMYLGSNEKTHPDGTVYILDAYYNWNHPHANAVIVDGDYVFFSYY
ncbi:MAG: hypothetical protein J5685_13050 [Clostridiales bacterium]|nr:hypothetical protein [Clostridiales bacterium]